METHRGCRRKKAPEIGETAIRRPMLYMNAVDASIITPEAFKLYEEGRAKGAVAVAASGSSYAIPSSGLQ